MPPHAAKLMNARGNSEKKNEEKLEVIMQSLLNLIGHVMNSVLALIAIVLILDIILRNYLAKSGKDISAIPAGDIIRDTSLTILAAAKTAVSIEDKELLQKVVIAIIAAVFLLIRIFVIR